MSRCYDPRNKSFRYYGGRGITVHESWHDVAVFIAEVEYLIGPRPAGLTLDRVDNSRNYEPGNVRWASQSEQVRNSRRIAWQEESRVAEIVQHLKTGYDDVQIGSI